MDRNNGHDCPRVLAEQLAHMVEFADSKNDFVLAAWLTQAQERIRDEHIDQ